MTDVLAVSGGVDSVVLLDLYGRLKRDCVVAHVDHGMRDDSAADARFVAALAERYRLPFVERRLSLAGANEMRAREERYAFLFSVAEQYSGRVVTAHHQDDTIETIALNLQRGTQWRGLAGMSDPRIYRPLVRWTKGELRDYARRRRLEWVEDETNAAEWYTRNRIRRRLAALDAEDQERLFHLWCDQHRVARLIEQEIDVLMGASWPGVSRALWGGIDPAVAVCALREAVRRWEGGSLLTEQAERLVVALKTGRPGTRHHIGAGLQVKLTARDGIIERIE